MEGRYNLKNPSVKRILQEVKELQGEGSSDLIAEALEANIFEWHFAIRGQIGSDYEGGIYHGRILLPAEYPFKPPDFMMLTPSGRFEVGKRICLSISQFHPEHWQPSWSVRTALTALIAFMPTPGEGALGSLDYRQDEKKRLALLSRIAPPKFGNTMRQEVTVRIHEQMLKVAPLPESLKKDFENIMPADAMKSINPSSNASEVQPSSQKRDTGQNQGLGQIRPANPNDRTVLIWGFACLLALLAYLSIST